jgi:hypothetical protein
MIFHQAVSPALMSWDRTVTAKFKSRRAALAIFTTALPRSVLLHRFSQC